MYYVNGTKLSSYCISRVAEQCFVLRINFDWFEGNIPLVVSPGIYRSTIMLLC